MSNHPAKAGAKKSSFYMAMRFLSKAQRNAIFQIYAFCREVDDIADNNEDRGIRFAALHDWRTRIEAIYNHKAQHQDTELANTVKAFSLEKADFLAVIDGMAMDIENTICAPDFATLDLYCDRVASAVGRLIVNIFGLPREKGIVLSHHLGRALQLTNILRDLDEDAARNRLYLPNNLLKKVKIVNNTYTPNFVLSHQSLDTVCKEITLIAKKHFEEAAMLMSSEKRKNTKAPRLMASVYLALLNKLTERGWRAPRKKIHLSKMKLLSIIVRHAIF